MGSIGRKVVTATSNLARTLGSALDNLGAQIEVAKYTEKLVPSTRFVAVDNVAPSVSPATAFVAPSASVIGDVTIGAKSSIWYGATVRGDVNKVQIGANSNIGDHAVIHVAKIQNDFPTLIGNNVTVGPAAMVHAATLADDVVIGASAQVLDGAVVESQVVIAPGSVVTPGTVVTGGHLWSGSPAKKIRELTPDEIKSISESAEDLSALALQHAFECDKDYKQLAEDEELYDDEQERDLDYWKRDEGGDDGDVLGQGAPGRIFDSTLSHPERAVEKMNKEAMEKDQQK